MTRARSLFTFGFCLLLPLTAEAADLPASWYQLPEHEAGKMGSLAAKTATPSTKQREELQRKELSAQLHAIFSTQTAALEAFSAAAGETTIPKTRPATNPPKNETTVPKPRPRAPLPPLPIPGDDHYVPWRMTGFVTDLGLSVNGKIGLLAWQGSPAVATFWMKKEDFEAPDTNNAPIPETASSGDPGIAVNADATTASLDAEIDAVLKGVMATQQVRDEAELRKNFREAVYAFVDLAEQVDKITTDTRWQNSRLRIDLNMNASGRVSWFTKFGVNIRVRLEWYRLPGKKQKSLQPGSRERLRLQGLENFLLALCEDLDAAMEGGKNSPSSHFEPRFLKVGLGVATGGNIGIVRAGTAALMHMYFTWTGKRPRKPAAAAATARLPLHVVDNAPSEALLRLARNEGRLVKVAADEEGGLKDALYKLDRETFRKYMRRAIFIGSYFAEAADKAHSKNWQPRFVKTVFDVSLTGRVGIATASGIATGDITFQNKNF
jgi:hypothetical protein